MALSAGASTSAGAAVVLPGNQPPVPAENRVKRDDAGDLRQNPPAEFLASHRESTALGVGHSLRLLGGQPLALTLFRRFANLGRFVAPYALIDTGAQDCYVDVDLARKLRLDLRGRDPVGRIRDVRGPQNVLTYSTLIVIDRFDITLHDPCPGYKIRALGGEFGVILGRQFLLQMRMLYDGPSGSVTMQRVSPN